jgi:hypothetical protein
VEETSDSDSLETEISTLKNSEQETTEEAISEKDTSESEMVVTEPETSETITNIESSVTEE